MAMPGRTYSATTQYRYGFNGKELDGDIDGNNYDYGFRIYNPALGRFLSVDPLFKSYPWYTPYQFAGNKVTTCIDLDGLEEKDKIGNIELDADGLNSGQINIGLSTSAYTHAQREALALSTSNPGKLAVLQQQTYNGVLAQIGSIISSHFDPNYFNLDWVGKVSNEIQSDDFLTGSAVSKYNSYTDYSTPGSLVTSGTSILQELNPVVNTLVNNYRQDAFFNRGAYKAAIDKETEPNKKAALMQEMVQKNTQNLITLNTMCFMMFQPEGGGGASSASPKIAGRFEKFASMTETEVAATVEGVGVSFGDKTVPVYRGGNSFDLKTKDFKLNAEGLVKTTHGVSLDVNAGTVSGFGGAYKIEFIPDGLQIIQRGKRLEHFEIVPSYEMPVEQFQNLLNQIKTTATN